MSGGSGVPSTSFLASADYGDPNADAASGNVAGGEAGYYGGGGGGGFGGGDYFDDGGGQRGGGTTMAGGPGPGPGGVGVGGDPYYGVDAVDPAAGGVVPPQQQPRQRQQQLRQQQQQRWMTDDDDGDVDPRLSTLPRILLMGPRRAGKTSIQRVVFNKMSPHETLFRLEATQGVERTVVNEHAALSRFAMWDFPGDYYGGGGVGVGGVGVGGPGGTAMMGSHQPGGATMMGGGGSPHGGYHEQQQQQGYPTHQHGGAVPRHEMDGGGGGYPPPPPVPVPGADDGDDANDDYSDAAPAAQLEAEAAAREAAHAAAEAEEEADRRIYSGSASKTCLIFVMDAQDEPYDHVLQNFTHTVTRAVRANPSISIEVFINKVDGELFLSDEAKYDCRRDIMQQVSDELHDAGFGGGDGGEDEFDPVGSVNYHLTSIYDHSIFEAFSRVVQKLIPHLQPTLENLLNVLVSSCAMEKAYLFDVASKLYISTDSSPVDMQSVELCSDMIDVVLDVSGIYGTHTTEGGGGGGGATDADGGAPGGGPLLTDGGVGEDLTSAAIPPPADDGFGISSVDATATSSVAAGSLPGPSTSASGGADTHALEEPPDGTTVAPLVEGDGSAGAGEGGGDGGGGGLGGEAARSSSASELEPGFGPGDDGIGDGDYNIEGGEVGSSPAPETAPEETSAYDDGSSSVIRLSNGMVLYLREVDSMLALVCLTRCENFRKRSLIDYNISRLKRALKSLVVAVPPASSAPSTPLDGTASSGMNGSAPSAVGR